MPLALTHSPVDPDEQMLTKHCISRLVSRSDQDRNTKTTVFCRLISVFFLHEMYKLNKIV